MESGLHLLSSHFSLSLFRAVCSLPLPVSIRRINFLCEYYKFNGDFLSLPAFNSITVAECLPTITFFHMLNSVVSRPCPGGARYCIPTRGLYPYATCAHYLTELVMWAGFALASCGPNGLFIFLVSFCNLVPRSQTTHEWSVIGQEFLSGLS